jgi:mannosyltransferase OCH1-like enzyme
MIPLKFGLFWSGTTLSYLRFLTFVSLRKNHPNAKIELWISNKSSKNASWRSEKQDFQKEEKSLCYLDKLHLLDVDIFEKELFPTYAPNYQSDFFRWWWLYNNGGFYLDTDQIILKPFDDLLNTDFIYSIYRAVSCGIYSPVGVIGAKEKCPIVKDIMAEMPNCYKPDDYNSLGPFMFRNLYSKHQEAWHKGNSHPNSQEFNGNFSEKSCFRNEDTLSLLGRGLTEYWWGLV